MASAIQENFRIRKDYSTIGKVIEIPNLIDIQKRSYDAFLQPVPEEVRRQGEYTISEWEQTHRDEVGLQAVFNSVFPIVDFNQTSSLEFVSYRLDKPKYDVDECRSRGMTFAAPIKVVIRLVVWDVSEDSEIRTIHDVKEQEVFFGEIPLMTENGTFIINGTERVIVSQLHRSPGAFFDHDRGKSHSSGKLLYSARIIPYRGSWVDFEFDAKDVVHVRIDRRRKMPATILLRALGYSTEDLLRYYYQTETIFLEANGITKSVEPDLLSGQVATIEIPSPEAGRPIVREGKKISQRAVKKIVAAGITRIPIREPDLVGKVVAEDVFDLETGEVLLTCNAELTAETVLDLRTRKISELKVLFIDDMNVGSFLRDTLLADKIETTEEAILEIYQRLRPGDPPSMEQAEQLFDNLFFNAERYDLSKVGRLKLNHKFKLNVPLEETTLTREDILETVRHLLDLKNNRGQVDDIDHLGNRRVRAVGELLENQYRIGLVRMERAIKERMSMSQDVETQMPHDLINAKPVSAVVKEYFGSSQLSQFMDQTNPLGEVTHKRRLSALGPGGLTRDRAGFEVRDVHTTHYGRICPIETPEGPNIGLIASLSTYGRVNEYGFIETPYRKVDDGRLTGEVAYFSALEEEEHIIAQANTPFDPATGALTTETAACRHRGEFVQEPPDRVTLMDVSPNQLVSVAASLIPFLENDDANRALMGSNMQRQAVPLLRTAAPLVGTGIEYLVARDSGVTMVARHDGVIESVDAGRIVVRRTTMVGEDEDASARPDIYNLVKYRRSNQNTCVNQKPIVEKGDLVTRGDILADGPGIETGELALGQNLVVAFMPWGGYNFEDSILISERVTKEDVFTSIHIEEFECIARDTKLGKEEITCDIPNVGEEALRDLDDSGIIRIGAEVQHGDILVGKVTPKGETQLSPEEKLLRAIFGEKAGDVRDSSLRVPPGVQGTVIGAKVFVRRGADKDDRATSIEDAEEARILKDQNDEIEIIRDATHRRVRELLVDKTTAAKLVDDKKRTVLDRGETLTAARLGEIPARYLADVALLDDPATEARIARLFREVEQQIAEIRENAREKIEKLKRGDELPPGVIKMVKVYVAIKRKLQVGDKMAGRHGNKGVVSRILPEEDMPFLDDGTPVDVVLNPLGVPSRMNIGQVMEVHLGWAALGIGKKLNEIVEQYKNPASLPAEVVTDLKAKLTALYDQPVHRDLIAGLNTEDLVRLVRKVRRGAHIATPVFDGADEAQIRQLLAMAGLPESGQMVLFDGRTGEPFDGDVTVGVMYVLKLHHLVDDKIHARSIGPYSLVTQQPLGGKAQFGGQRLGEMEVWAMEAYGAAYSLQEFLTVKSDDVSGRTRMYESIVRGEMKLDAGLPESFNVLIKELHSLCLNVELLEDVA